MRDITNDDMWAAIRGLGMAGMEYDELTKLANEYRNSPDFAGQVIAKAADQYAVIKRARRDDDERKAALRAKRRSRR